VVNSRLLRLPVHDDRPGAGLRFFSGLDRLRDR
jgi:hypothetical protein